jgi:hypothetical protein
MSGTVTRQKRKRLTTCRRFSMTSYPGLILDAPAPFCRFGRRVVLQHCLRYASPFTCMRPGTIARQEETLHIAVFAPLFGDMPCLCTIYNKWNSGFFVCNLEYIIRVGGAHGVS